MDDTPRGESESPGPDQVEPGDVDPHQTGGARDEATGEAGDDAVDGAIDEAVGRDPRRFNDWRKRSATGVVMTGIALGLQEALELPRQQPALVIEAPGEPDDPDHPIDLRFDPDSPEDTVAIVRHREDGDAARPPGQP